MGQYFKPINLDRQEYCLSHDYGSGLKLTEHSWLYNSMVNAIVHALSPMGNWFGCRLVWAGDYMDEGIFLKGIKGKRREDKTLYHCCLELEAKRKNKDAPIHKIILRPEDGPEPSLIVNHDRREFVLLSDLPEEDPRDPGWCLHPLPLLTCSGNGRGGGDFQGENAYTGCWAGHRISSEFSPPKGYNQLVPAFTERVRTKNRRKKNNDHQILP